MGLCSRTGSVKSLVQAAEIFLSFTESVSSFSGCSAESPSPFLFFADVRGLVYWQHDHIHQSLQNFQAKEARFWIVPITPFYALWPSHKPCNGCPLHSPKDGQPMAALCPAGMTEEKGRRRWGADCFQTISVMTQVVLIGNSKCRFWEDWVGLNRMPYISQVHRFIFF